MIDGNHGLSIAKQAKALGISCGTVHYSPKAVSPTDLVIMRRMDELHLDSSLAGSRMLRDLFNHEGIEVGRRHVAMLMERMGIAALYRKPNTSKPEPGHKIYPYLLRGVTVDRPDQAWAMDFTYVPMARGFVYLAASRRLVFSPGSGLAAVDHHRGRVLRQGAQGSAWPAWQAGRVQH